jgi:hypothetical protein
VEENAGNGYDTDNNAEDFVLQTTSNPQNSSSPPETDTPIPVELTSFTAEMAVDHVLLRWTTQSETENLGFHVYRSDSQEGEYARINPQIIPGVGTTAERHDYEYRDYDVTPGRNYWYKLADVKYDGTLTFHGPASTLVTGINMQRQDAPMRYRLYSAHPNPFSSDRGQATALRYDLAKAGHVTLKIYNVQGQVVRTLVDENREVGSYSVLWNGTDGAGRKVASGVYVYTLKVNGFEASKKMTFMK